MAINGWYVNRIITDIQEGKVDEFVNKEGKWFNYIIGEDTTHTNAIDNSGTIAGNLDVNEFSVQGIGKLSIDATVASGTTPNIGGNVVVTFSGGSNWTTTGFSIYNQSSFPSTGTFTIEPVGAYGISAADFSALSLTLPLWISSITFADTGTPSLSNNTVTGTITFDATSSAGSSFTSGTSLTDDITLAVTVQPALVSYKATLIVNGVFYTSDGPQDVVASAATYSTYNLISSTNLQKVYEIEKFVVPGVTTKIVDYVYSPGPNVITGSPNVNYSVQPGELAQYQESIQAPGVQIGVSNYAIPSNNYTIEVNYTTNSLAVVDEANEITVNLNSSQGVCFFDTTQSTYALPDNGGIVTIPIQNNLGPFNVTFSGGIAASGVVNNTNTIDNTTSGGQSFLSLDLTENTSGSNITGTIKLFSNGNTTTTENDSINVEQGLASTVNTTAALKDIYTNANGAPSSQWTYAYPPANSTAGYYSDLNGTGTNPKVDASTTEIVVRAEVGNFLSPGGLNDNFSIAYSDPNNTGWITDQGFTAAGGSQSQYSGFANKFYDITAQPVSGAERTAIITYPHPNDPALTSSVTITQEAGYDASTNTLAFSNTTNTSPYTYADGVDIEVDHNAQTVTLYANIPSNDLSSDNPFNYDSQNITLNALSPAPYWTNNSNFADNSATHSLIYPGSNTSFTAGVGAIWWNISPEPNTPNVTVSNTLIPAHGITHKIDVHLDQNYNVDSTDKDFPIDRQFNLLGYNPENTQLNNQDDSIVIKQTAQPCARWNTGPSAYNNTNGDPHAVNEYPVASTYSDSDGIDITFKANGSTPNVSCFAAYDSTNTVWVSPSSHPSINSITVAATSNTNEYNTHIDLAENFTGSDVKFTLGAYHSSVSNHQTEDPTGQGIKADPITIVQSSASLLLEAITPLTLPNGVFPGGGGVIASTFNNIGYLKHQIIVSLTTFTGDISIPINYNSNTPLVANITNQLSGAAASSGTASWLGSTPAVNASNNLIINFDSANSSGASRTVTFDLQHSSNNSAFMTFEIIQLG